MLARRAACNLVSSQFDDGEHNGDIIWFIGAQLRDLEQIVDEQASGERRAEVPASGVESASEALIG